MNTGMWIRRYFFVLDYPRSTFPIAFNRVTGRMVGFWEEGGIFPKPVYDTYLQNCIKE